MLDAKLTSNRLKNDCKNVSKRSSWSSYGMNPKSPPNICIDIGANNAVDHNRNSPTLMTPSPVPIADD